MNETTDFSEGFLSSREAQRILHVTAETLREWSREGKIEFIRAEGKRTHRRYNVNKFLRSGTPKKIIRRKIIYARVSTKKQSESLSHQIEYLRNNFPEHELISDVGSGINFKRKGLNAILDYAFKGNLEEVVVTYEDRLCRFGFDLFETIFRKLSNAKIVVLNKNSSSQDEELAGDVLEIVTVFSAKINGRKRYKTNEKSPINDNENQVVSD
jgi:predicted site-specific integrase-resolvase